MFWLGRRWNEVLGKRKLEGMRGWTRMVGGRGCDVLLSDGEVYLRTCALHLYPYSDARIY